ncbi:LytR/AlgR family response regulator transcription factor [Aquimarina aquimarini]|uniref:LytR/AlgR family response regulator transcription factor n=1 Tax=Aquimarina aquimarini TaxID=1191734 RepID=UPI001F1D78B5|nr:LytTR family DNA-binding domain-containing protein [Aquimarina aquimarini]
MEKKLSCIIIDDEKKDRENIRLLLQTYCPQVKILGEGWDNCSILKILSNTVPDVIFMDVQIGGYTAFEILNELKDLPSHIVFVSAHDKYAIRGYKYQALDYILKPIDFHKLIEVIQRVSGTTLKKPSISFFNPMTKKISITDAKGIYVIDIYSVIYCLSNGNYTTFILNSRKEIIISKNLKYFENKLADYGFIRVHKSYLVNLAHIDYLAKEDGGTIIMQNNDTLPISKNFKKGLYERMNII